MIACGCLPAWLEWMIRPAPASLKAYCSALLYTMDGWRQAILSAINFVNFRIESRT